MSLLRPLAAICGPLFLVSSATAHDFWIQPTVWQPQIGGVVGLHLVVGHDGEREALPRMTERVLRFFAFLPAELGKEVAVVGAEGRAPAGYLRLNGSGLHLVGYVSHPRSIEMEPAKFEAYLREEGLEQVVRLRAQRGESARPGRELYSRSAKCLFRAGSEDVSGFDRVIGLPLELVSLDDPFGLEPGSKLRLRLLENGQPRAGVLIDGQLMGSEPELRVASRSDERGLVTFELPEHRAWNGEWLFAGVAMKRAPESGPEQWRSTWASLTFEVPAPTE